MGPGASYPRPQEEPRLRWGRLPNEGHQGLLETLGADLGPVGVYFGFLSGLPSAGLDTFGFEDAGQRSQGKDKIAERLQLHDQLKKARSRFHSNSADRTLFVRSLIYNEIHIYICVYTPPLCHVRPECWSECLCSVSSSLVSWPFM